MAADFRDEGADAPDAPRLLLPLSGEEQSQLVYGHITRRVARLIVFCKLMCQTMSLHRYAHSSGSAFSCVLRFRFDHQVELIDSSLQGIEIELADGCS